jgi:hypothetical protein
LSGGEIGKRTTRSRWETGGSNPSLTALRYSTTVSAACLYHAYQGSIPCTSTMEIKINNKGKEEKYWLDWELFRLHQEWLRKLKGLDNEYEKLFAEWQRKNKK